MNSETPGANIRSFRRRTWRLRSRVRLYRRKAEGRFHTAWTWTNGWFPPAAVCLCLFALLYETDQVITLARAIAMALDRPETVTDTGYACGLDTVFGWWLSCGLMLCSLALFMGDTHAGAAAPAAPRPGWPELLRLPLNWFAALLVLAPVLLHPATDPFTPWGLFGIFALYPFFCAVGFASAALGAKRWLRVAIAVTPSLMMLLVLYRVYSVSAMLFATPLALVVRVHGGQWPKWTRWRHALPLSAALFCILLSTLMPAALLNVAAWPALSGFARAILLTFWWQLPALYVLSMPRAAFWLRKKRRVQWLFALCATCLVAAASLPERVYLPCTLVLFAAFALTFIRLTSGPRPSFWRRAAALCMLIGACVGFVGLGPSLDFSILAKAPMVRAIPQSRFHDFYVRWLASRSERPDRHGALVLVAAAGGGLRAAAHTALSLAAMDDVTDGRFGKRVLAISGVSGGALGMATWLGIQTDGIDRSLMSISRHDDIFKERRVIGEFYRGDFATPVLNRMLAHDIPLAALPIRFDLSDRDVVLREAWENQWGRLLTGHGLDARKSVFKRSLAELGADPANPLIIMNTTSTQDGMRAVYSSFPARFSGARLLDSRMMVSKAVMDSARFALVSPIRNSCSDTPPPFYVSVVDDGTCSDNPRRALPVADGGYIDNSGLASLAEIVDELKREGDDLKQVFVIVISSDGGAGLVWRDGRRFLNGYLAAELSAPGFVMDAARSAHTAAYKELIGQKLAPDSIDEWNLATFYRDMAERMAKIDRPTLGLKVLDDWASASFIARRIDLPPLGWTIDRWALSTMIVPSISHTGPDKMTDCEAYVPRMKRFCRALNDGTNGTVSPKQSADPASAAAKPPSL